MNLKDLLGDDYLKQDKWSLTNPVFGEHGNLRVVGWSDKNNSGIKYYVVHCLSCVNDSELFGEGYFKCNKSNLTRGQYPCGCSKSPRLSQQQYGVLCSRKAEELGYKFLGFVGEWRGYDSKIELQCQIHKSWQSGDISNLLKAGNGCPACRTDKAGIASKKPDEVIIGSFFASGAFHPNTKFWRSERKNPRGHNNHWYMYCPDCDVTIDSLAGNLKAGKRPCACSLHRQQQAYVHLVKDQDLDIALKFGIANIASNRLWKQNQHSLYNITSLFVYNFPDKISCVSAEKECKKELTCGILTKQEMSDGYTETTYLYNLNKIISIYEKHGGVRI